MKPVDQTLFGHDGNCMTACVASILEIGLNDVPEFNPMRSDKYWYQIYIDFLKERGLSPLCLSFNKTLICELGLCWTIVSGEGPRGLNHATVWRRGEMRHDPHPSRDGLIEPKEIDVFVVMDPAGQRRIE